MNKQVTKPIINFDVFKSLENFNVEGFYDNCKDKQDLIDYVFMCLGMSETLGKYKKTSIASKEYFILFNYLYQHITGRTYQSKISI